MEHKFQFSNENREDQNYSNNYQEANGELSCKIELSLEENILSGTLSALVDDNSFKTTNIHKLSVLDASGNKKQALVHVFSNQNYDLVKNLNVKLNIKISLDVSDWDFSQKTAQLFNCNDNGKDMNFILGRLTEILKKSPNYQCYPYEVLDKVFKMNETEFNSFDFTKTESENQLDIEDPKQHGGVILVF